MKSFVIVAAVMAAIAASIIAVPLMRDKKNRLIGALAALLVAGSAAALYPLWSNWDWHGADQPQSQPAAAPDVAAMVTKLENHLRNEDPNDLAGWLMLGRSYLALQRPDDAVTAYDHAHKLGSNMEASLGLGEAISVRAGGEVTAAASQLFEEALKLSPANPKALLYGGFAAASRGDRALARIRWQALKDLHPPPQIEQMLDTRIAELGPSAPTGTDASPTGTSASAPGSAAAQVTVTIRIAPTLKSRLKPEVPVFVFAREPGSQGPPLAAKRLTGADIGTQVRLSGADSMMPGRVLVAGQHVSVTARVSFSGRPTPAAGDLYGELAYEVGRDGALDLVIDRIAD